jgi:hypothetical protein
VRRSPLPPRAPLLRERAALQAQSACRLAAANFVGVRGDLAIPRTEVARTCIWTELGGSTAMWLGYNDASGEWADVYGEPAPP